MRSLIQRIFDEVYRIYGISQPIVTEVDNAVTEAFDHYFGLMSEDDEPEHHLAFAIERYLAQDEEFISAFEAFINTRKA